MTAFDELAKTVFSRVRNLMGENAVWHSSSNGEYINGKVLFKDPTEPQAIGGDEQYEYHPEATTIEFYTDTFRGIKENVDSGKEEFITVRNQKYFVVEVLSKFDGNTYTASLKKSEDE